MARLRWRLWLRLGVTALLLWLLVRGANLSRVVGVVGAVQPLAMAAGVAFSIATLVLLAARWQRMLGLDRVAVPLLTLTFIYLEAAFFGLVLPSAIGGDVFRGLRLVRLVNDARLLAVNIVMERAAGLWATCLLAVLGAVASPRLPGQLLGVVVIIIACVVLGSLLTLAPPSARLLCHLLDRLGQPRLARWVGESGAQARAYVSDPKRLTYLLGLSVLPQLSLAVSAYFCAAAVGAAPGLGFFFFAMPVVSLLSLLPAIGGIGPREAGLAYALMEAGESRETAIAASAAFLMTFFARALLGALSWLLGGAPSPRAR